MSNDCRTCRFNTYRDLGPDITREWFSCSHPATIAKTPKFAPGDPIMVSWRTGDVRMDEIFQFADCPTHEPASPAGDTEAGR